MARRSSAMFRRGGGSGIALVTFAIAALAAAVLLPRCPFHVADAQLLGGILNALVSTITGTVAATLGLVGGTVTTVTGIVVDVTSLLSVRVQCSGRLCVDLSVYSNSHPDIADVNARVLLWSPKVSNTSAGQKYDPTTKDWVTVVDTCRTLFKYEKRLASFFIRSSFHDSMAVDVSMCPGPDCGGADGSLLLSIEELTRPENAYDNFSLMTARAAKKIASFFDISVADTLAVCAAVAPEVLSNGRVKILPANGTKVLRVGRLDSIRPAPPSQLPPDTANIDAFASFWAARGINAKEAVALMGSHALLDTQACFKGPNKKDYCNPATEDCTNVRMFRWENHYYKDICSPTLDVRVADPEELVMADTPVLGMTDPEMEAEARLETCKFTSKEGRSMAMNALTLLRSGAVVDPDASAPPQEVDVTWSNKNCLAGGTYGVPATHCPHANQWLYTPNDAYIGQACQGVGNSTASIAARAAARSYITQANWDATYITAYRKMVTNFATFSSASAPFFISGHECASGTHLEAACAQSNAGIATTQTKTLYAGNYVPLLRLDLLGVCDGCSQDTCSKDQCYSCAKVFNTAYKNNLVTGPNCCGCSTLLRDYRYNATGKQVIYMPFISRFADVFPTTVQPAQPLPAADAGAVPERPLIPDPVTDSIAPSITVGGAFANPPKSPYGDLTKLCPATDDVSVKVDGFPSSPFKWTPFTQAFATPPPAQRANSYKKAGTNLTVDAYEIDIYPVDKDLGCPKGPTHLLSYNGSVPGPSFRILKGRQTLIRFNNRMTLSNLSGTPFSPFHPCETTTGREGRPISVHMHGEASLAPYDGWAEDTTCGAESKDYYYANRRPGYSWYHDHQLDITSENAYYGLAGMYVVHDNINEGGCGEPWNLDAMPDYEMQFKDAVLDGSCQLYYDRPGPHKNNLYGDINFVNGIPWPVATMEPRANRFRWLVAAVSRPYKIRVVDSEGADVGGSICKVVASEAGVRRTAVTFPAAGLFMGVAERYEVVCDFTNYAGKSLYLWNALDEKRMKGVPFFCHSHLVMKINVSPCSDGAATCAPPGTALMAEEPARPTLDNVLNSTDIEQALTMARNKECTRTFRFGRRNGHWVINGESWHSARVAAADIGQNTWEVWCLETGGGWFHPIHIHLVDFYVLTRNHEEAQVHEYERWAPKDVVQLNPGNQVSLLLRFGPHRGEYMFHCHNLVHEDFEMMRSFDTVHTAGSRTSETALPMQAQPTLIQNLNVIYDLYKDPVNPNFGPRKTSSLSPLRTKSASVNATVSYAVTNGIYRIFYPGGAINESPLLSNRTVNPWLVNVCQTQNA